MAKKLLSAAVLTAAVAGGGALGVALGAPTLSAAQDTPTTTAGATDEGPTTTTEPAQDDSGDHAANCDHGEGHRPGHGPMGRAGRMGLSTAAEALGMSQEELRDELRTGASLASIAEERGVDAQKVIDALVAEASTRIEARVNGERPGG